MHPMLHLAAKIALPVIDNDKRSFYLGCVGIRNDGVIVSARNGAVEFSDTIKVNQLIPSSHAEGRVLRKLGKRGTMFVSRVAKGTKKLAMSCPCGLCQVRIKAFDVKRVYYTINEFQYGIWNVKLDEHKVFTV